MADHAGKVISLRKESERVSAVPEAWEKELVFCEIRTEEQRQNLIGMPPEHLEYLLLEYVRTAVRAAENEKAERKVYRPKQDDIEVLDLIYALVYSPDNVLLEELELQPALFRCKVIKALASQITTELSLYPKHRNCSARRAWNTCRNPDMLLWMAAVLGEEPDLIRTARAVQNAADGNTAGICAAVRAVIPFSRINTLVKLQNEPYR